MTTTSVLIGEPEAECAAPSALDLALAEPAARVQTLGRNSVSPFLAGADRRYIELADGGIAGYLPRSRWAVFATSPATPVGTEDAALAELVGHIQDAHRRPVFAAVPDPDRYRALGMYTEVVADDPVIDLTTFSLTGKRRATIRHSVTSARRAGLRVVDYRTDLHADCRAVSDTWLATKRGGEMGFTLGRFAPGELADRDCHVAFDSDGRVCGFTTWHRFDDGRGRVLDLMRRRTDAPNPTMDLLLGDALLRFQAAGIERASLGCVPRSHGRLAERAYPTRSLYRFKDKYGPEWQPRHLAAPTRARLPGALLALGRSYCCGGLRSALRRNG